MALDSRAMTFSMSSSLKGSILVTQITPIWSTSLRKGLNAGSACEGARNLTFSKDPPRPPHPARPISNAMKAARIKSFVRS